MHCVWPCLKPPDCSMLCRLWGCPAAHMPSPSPGKPNAPLFQEKNSDNIQSPSQFLYFLSPSCLNRSPIKVVISHRCGSMRAIWCYSTTYRLLILNWKASLLSLGEGEKEKAGKKEKRAAPEIQQLTWNSQVNIVILLPDINNSQNTNLRQGYSEIMINEAKQSHLLVVSKQGQQQGHCATHNTANTPISEPEWVTATSLPFTASSSI